MAIPAEVEARINSVFSYHAPKGNQQERYETIRSELRRVALMVLELCPDSRERSIALTRIEESVMWANASIARNE